MGGITCEKLLVLILVTIKVLCSAEGVREITLVDLEMQYARVGCDCGRVGAVMKTVFVLCSPLIALLFLAEKSARKRKKEILG